jgi:hypothetical protein
MQFQVPQFLDVEDKIIGPLTIKQFIYIIGGFGGGYVVFRFIPWTLVSVIPALAVVALGLALAFYRFNNKPFVFLLESGFLYLTSNRLYLWKKREKKSEDQLQLKLTQVSGKKGIAATGERRLNALSWEIDSSGNVIDQELVEPDDRF